MIVDFVIGKIALIIFMLICAVSDFIDHSVNTIIFIIAAVLEASVYLFFAVFGYEVRWISIFAGVGIGGLLAAVSLISKGKMGIGDAYFFGVTGFALGGLYNGLLFAGGIMLSAFYALVVSVILFFKKKNIRGYRFALLPFVLPVGMLMVFSI